MARKRAAARDIHIPIPKEPNRRRDCLQDPELLFRTYFPLEFYEDFTTDRREMIRSIIHAAKYGGDQAIAGPRGEGKTSLAINGGLYLMLALLSTFPVVIGKSQGKAQLELKALREKLQQEKLFIADFPEIGIPFQSVGAWSSRARMQTVGGQNTNIEIAPDHIAFPTISREQLPDAWPDDIEPVSQGQVMFCLGMDGPIRGTKFRSRRPTLSIIDDIEDREAAFSDPQIAKNEEIIEQDIAALGTGSRRVSRVYLCTIQNRKCNAFKYTDPKKKPSFKGRRYRKMIRPPDRMDLVEQYISLREERAEDDPDAREAHRFWRDNQEAIEAGCEVSNLSSYDGDPYEDGEPLELSAIQAYYNRVADWGKKAVATEIDNDPPEDIGPQGAGLTASLVAERISGLDKLQVPANATKVTAAIDLGKYKCHWVIVAWWKGAGGAVIDYGVMEVAGTDASINNEQSEPHIYNALLQWRDDLLQKQLVDAAGAERKIDTVFVDSGTFTNAAYEFVRQVKSPFYACKGTPNYKQRAESTEKIKAGDHMHASYLSDAKLWLFNLGTDYWKNWVHERFLTPTFDENNLLRRGSLSLYAPVGRKKHSSYAQHIVAEELVSEFKEGKGTRTYWFAHNDNNHWLDATYYASCAGRFAGVNLLSHSEVENKPVERTESERRQKAKRPQHGRKPHATRFRNRPGGWIKGIGRT